MFLRAHPLKTSLRPSTFLVSNHHTVIRPAQQLGRRLAHPRSISQANSTYRSPWKVSSEHYKTNSISWTLALAFGVAIGGALLVPLAHKSPKGEITRHDSVASFDLTDLTDSYLVMAPNTPPGRPGTLTAEEEKKLRELWAMTLKVFGVDASVEEANGAETPVAAAAAASDAGSEKDVKKDKKKSRLNVFRRNKDDKTADSKTTSAGSTTPSDISSLSISADDDKFGQTADFKAAIANTPPEELRRAFWSMVKHDHPDALLLRFLRARKWDVEKALVMMISTMHWRLDEMHVDDDIVKNGELGAMDDTNATDAKVKKNSEDFLAQLRMGKSYLHGLDIEGRPMCFVRARLHRAGEQTEESLAKFTVYTIETARMLLRPPIDTATIVFDMTDFSMANMDYTPVKFMIKCFEANYPESLGTVLVYKAPWVFNAIWSIIRGWLDPVVAGKVHFAKNIDELEKFVPRNQIPSELGGDEKWTYAYPEPVPGENEKMNDQATRTALEGERADVVKKYENTVVQWIHEGDGDLEEKRKERNGVAEELRQNYWKLDPYVRARTLYDRMGMLSEGGQLAFYPKAQTTPAPPAAAARVSTSADDLD
ncbi:hypothetical protein HBI46_169390 [Parastagonospora nodorum]|nr:hypothetical protein HBI09_123470 [Parastagonospora nodorum]KAH5002299.1 hypothetical protein HBI77_138020 [Parastagonospora nodorum]KAH5410352.1 hypothetical protein HBI46_169390 [Parastagonospora nodorum]KAH6160193.1 hypothetical protein HBI68_127450 [Parastagonospora nodorum]